MKFSFVSLIALASLDVFAQSDESSESVAEPVQLSRFTVEPEFTLSEDSSASIFVNNEDTRVTFKFTNKEPFPVQVVAFGGSFKYPGSSDPYANLTTTPITNFIAEANSNKSYSTDVKTTLPPQDFDLEFYFLVGYEGISEYVSSDLYQVSVLDPPVSSWDPKFLFVQLIIGATVLVGTFWISNTYVIPFYLGDYLKDKSKDDSKSGVVPNDKGYDESWIPPHHLKKTEKKIRKVK